MNTMSTVSARGFKIAHDAYVSRVVRMSKAQLQVEYRGILSDKGILQVWGGPQSKDELINACVNKRYPISDLNMAIHVLHHAEVSWPDCQWCPDAD